MNVFNEIKQQINYIADKLFAIIPNQKQLSVELPKNPEHGDLSTNIAMLIAKSLSKSPMEVAELISAQLATLPYISKVNVAAPGFINISFKNEVWLKTLAEIIKQDINFGDNNLGNNEAINIEFVSTNPTGPMHIGHSRGAIYGDTLAELMKKSGYKVTKEYYINDAGNQIDILAKSAYIRYLQELGDAIESIPEGLYPGDYLIPVGKLLYKQFGVTLKNMAENERLEIIKKIAIDEMMKLIKTDLAELGVKHDVYFSEKTLHEENKITQLVDMLEKKHLVYRGVLAPPKGKITEDWEEREQLLFKTTDFGDDIDRALKKSNGEWTYAAADIAYMQNKIDRGFKKITMVLGADHLGYKKRMQAAAIALGGDKIEFEIKFCQLVNLFKNGQPFKMSKRKGNFITVEDVLEEVDKDIVRFYMLTRRNDQVLDFDFDKVKEQSKDNPVFYVQYANARINSILKNAHEQNPDFTRRLNDGNYDLTLLKNPFEIQLIKMMANWTKTIELACIHQEPHRIAFFLIELASEFHSFWNKGGEDPSLRFIILDNFETSLSRLVLAKAVKIIIGSGLKIFNVSPVDHM